MSFRKAHRILKVRRLDEEQRGHRPLDRAGSRSRAVENMTTAVRQNTGLEVSSNGMLLDPLGYLAGHLLPIVVRERFRALSKDENE